MTELARLDLAWAPPGPVAARFMASTAMVQILNGPIGSGKTTANLIKHIRNGARQKPSSKYRAHNEKGELVPVRRYRLAVIRDTYRQLWRALMPSWFRRVPRDAPGTSFSGAENAPATHRVIFQIGMGINTTIVDFEAIFAAIGELDVEEFMRGFEPTGWYLNELDLLAKAVLAFAQGRAGRFPDMDEGGPTWKGVTADCNAPEFESWLYRDDETGEDGRPKPGIFTMTPEERKAADVDLFIQPGGREAGAENVKNLPADYYKPKVGQSRTYVARMIDNQPGKSEAGMPVHPDFNHHRHVAPQELEPIPGLSVVAGIDPRTRPSIVVMQRLVNGQRRFIDELQLEPNTGARRAGAALAQLLHDRYPFLRPEQIRGICDPTAAYGADTEAGEETWMRMFAAAAGIRVDAAPGNNNIDLRREAIRKPLQELLDGGQPALLISPRCTLLTAGLGSGFRFRKLNVPGSTKYSDQPEKNAYADICEAAEYACLADGAEVEIMGRRAHDDARLRQMAAQAEHDWSPIQ